MSTKVKGDKIKEGSIPLSALAAGPSMLNNYKVDESYLITALTSHNTYFNIPENINIVYISAKNHNMIELIKGQKTTLGAGPGATIIYDNNGIKIDRNYNYYNVKVYRDIELISPNWNAQPGEPGYIENKPDIDPVVWKYLCNPCMIKDGERVPEELIGEFVDHGDNMPTPNFDTGYKLKYPNIGMYKMLLKVGEDDYGDISAVSSFEEYDNRGFLCYGGFTNFVFINSKKKWEFDR